MISKKVTHLITTIERGGAEKQLLTLASEQVQSGLNVVVLYLKGKPDLRNEFEESGVEVNDLLVGKSFLKQIFLLSKYLRKNPSPVHAHLPKSELLAAIVVTKKYLVFTFLIQRQSLPAIICSINPTPLNGVIVGGVAESKLKIPTLYAILFAC